jgi:lipid-A-disaccharide synthase-like uncharacterized protein
VRANAVERRLTPLALGWIGQGFYALRFLVQWQASERAGRSIAPRAFWWLSLAGAALLALYTASAGEPILCGGYLANGWIYVRQLRPPERRLALEPLAVSGLLALLWIAGIGAARSQGLPLGWLGVLLAGQAIWNGRFAWQWWLGERERQTHLSDSFWWWSLAGNALLLAYAIHRGDTLLICAFALGPIVQLRNLMIALRASEA